MSVFHTIQESFAAGEISPLLRGRTSTEGYKSGCKELVNFIADSRGPAIGRAGTKHIAELDDADGKLFSLDTEDSLFYVGLITDTRMRLFNSVGQPVNSNFIKNPVFGDGATDWNQTVSSSLSSVTFANRDCRITANPVGSQLVTNGNFLAFGTGWTERNDGNSTVTFLSGSVELIPNQGGGGNPRFAGIAQLLTISTTGTEHNIVVNGDFTQGNVRVRAGLSNGSGEFLDQIIGTDSILPFTPTADTWISIDCEKPQIQATLTLVSVQDPAPGFARIYQTITGLTPSFHTLFIDFNGASSVNVRIGTAENDGAYYDQLITTDTIEAVINIPTSTAVITLHVDSTNMVSVNSVGLTDPSAIFDVTAPWAEADIHDIHFVDLPDNSEMHFLHKNYPPQRLVYNSILDTFNFEPVPTTNFPTEWTGDSWPRTGSVLWGRMWYGGPPNQPNQFWGSRSGVYTDFIVPLTGATAVDPVTYALQKFGPIQWIEGTKALLIGSKYGEYVVKSDSRFTDVNEVPDIQQQSAYGSNSVQPQQVGDQVFYVSADGRKLRALQYEWAADNWLSNDLTFFSEHITKSGIINMGWQQNPNNVLWVTMGDGNIAALTYQRDQNIWGWSLLDAKQPYKSATSAQLGGSNFFVALLKRGTKLELIYQSLHRSGFLDDYVEKIDAVPFTSVDGLDYLEGQTVSILIDDPTNPNKTTDLLGVHPDRVVSGGQITLQTPATECLVGIRYVPKLVTLDLESLGRDGSGLTKIKHYSDIFVGVLNTFGITINGQTQPDRGSDTRMNTREPSIDGLIKVVDTGWKRSGTITIEQKLPLPVTILYISGKVDIEDV